MERYEYKTVALDFGHGVFKSKIPDLEDSLNHEAKDGWRLHEILVIAAGQGSSERFLVVLERKMTS